jgi:hypothetical protein
MHKLKLEIDALKVESFSITPAAGPDGTVHGQAIPPDYPNYPNTSFDCEGGGYATAGTCIGPTYCCVATWKPSCDRTRCGGCTGWDDSCVISCRNDGCAGA